MEKMKPQPFLPKLKKPFGWDLVTVLDPRVAGRTLQLWLMTRQFQVAKPQGTPEYVANAVKRVLVSPMMPSDKKSGPVRRVTITFAVVDPRYPPQVVELCLTPRQAELFRKTFAPSEKAVPVLTTEEGHLRFKCYIPGCKATSSDADFIGAHFEQGIHPGIQFDKNKVQIFKVNGQQDPAVLDTPSPFLLLPPAAAALENPSPTGDLIVPPADKATIHNTVTSTASSKRLREINDLSTIHSNKYIKRDIDTSRADPLVLRGDPTAQPSQGNSVDRLVSAYLKKHPVAGEIPAEEQELLCTCLQPADGRPMIECSNGDACRLRWYHLECLDMTSNDVPSGNDPWFCSECIKQAKRGKRALRACSSSPIDTTPRKKLKLGSARAKAEQATMRVVEELGGVVDPGSSDDYACPMSPSLTQKPWSANLVSSFAENSENVADYDLTTLASAKAALRARAAQPIVQLPTKRNAADANSPVYSNNYKSPNCRSWTAEEEQHLKDVVKECADMGLSGEALWAAAHPKLLARGVQRPVGGMKMRWCRGLRDETKIDERRKKNKKLLTALQKPKSDRDSNAPKKGRFKGKAYHAQASGSGMTLPPVPAPTTTAPPRQTLPAPAAVVTAPATATFPITGADFFRKEKEAAKKRAASI